MRYRPLGQSGIQTSVVAFGAWAIGGWRWGGTDAQASVQAIQAGLDAGIKLAVFELRDQVAPPWEILLVTGGIVAVLFVVALIGLLRWEPWAPRLLVGLAVFDIVGEFVGQGTIMIEIVVSFLVAVVLLILALRAIPRYQRGAAAA